MTDVLDKALSPTSSDGYMTDPTGSRRPLVVLQNNKRVHLADVEKNAPLVSGIIASGKDADWME